MAAFGLAGVEWSARLHVRPGADDEARRARRACEAEGVAVASYGAYLHVGVDDPSLVTPMLETALALGAPHIRIWAGPRGVAPAAVDDRVKLRAIDDLREVAAKAAALGLTLSLEHHRLTLTDGALETLGLLRAVGEQATNLFTYWQPRPRVRGRSALGELAALGPRLSHLHVFHWDSALARYPLHCGEGEWRAYLGAADAAPTAFRGDAFAFLEFVAGDDVEQLRRDAVVLKRLLSERQDGSTNDARLEQRPKLINPTI